MYANGRDDDSTFSLTSSSTTSAVTCHTTLIITLLCSNSRMSSSSSDALFVVEEEELIDVLLSSPSLLTTSSSSSSSTIKHFSSSPCTFYLTLASPYACPTSCGVTKNGVCNNQGSCEFDQDSQTAACHCVRSYLNPFNCTDLSDSSYHHSNDDHHDDRIQSSTSNGVQEDSVISASSSVLVFFILFLFFSSLTAVVILIPSSPQLWRHIQRRMNMWIEGRGGHVELSSMEEDEDFEVETEESFPAFFQHASIASKSDSTTHRQYGRHSNKSYRQGDREEEEEEHELLI